MIGMDMTGIKNEPVFDASMISDSQACTFIASLQHK